MHDSPTYLFRVRVSKDRVAKQGLDSVMEKTPSRSSASGPMISVSTSNHTVTPTILGANLIDFFTNNSHLPGRVVITPMPATSLAGRQDTIIKKILLKAVLKENKKNTKTFTLIVLATQFVCNYTSFCS